MLVVHGQGHVKQYLLILREGTGPEVKEFFGERDRFEQVQHTSVLPNALQPAYCETCRASAQPLRYFKGKPCQSRALM